MQGYNYVINCLSGTASIINVQGYNNSSTVESFHLDDTVTDDEKFMIMIQTVAIFNFTS